MNKRRNIGKVVAREIILKRQQRWPILFSHVFGKAQKNPTYPVTRGEISQGQHAFMQLDTITSYYSYQLVTYTPVLHPKALPASQKL